MSFHDAFNAELQLNTLIHRGRWDQALAALDEWLITEPWRTELLLRKAQLLRALHRYEQGLGVIREYRIHKPTAGDVAFLEAEFLLEMGQVKEAVRVLEGLPDGQRETALASYYRGRVQLARHEVLAGLQNLWNAYQREPGFNRALLEWATVAMGYYGKRWVRRHLEALLTRQRNNPTIAVSVGLALNMVDSRYGQPLLRHAVERYADDTPTFSRRTGGQKPPVPPQQLPGVHGAAAEAYRAVSEQLLAGHFEAGIVAYYRAVSTDPSWMPVLAPLAAEVLVDDLVRPEEARLLLEDAMKREPTDYRLHLSYTKVFLRLGFGEEALSSAGCALALSPEAERPIALVQRAAAHLLLNQHQLALADLQSAVTSLPDVRDLVQQEPCLRPLLQDRRLRALLGSPSGAPSFWTQLKRWLLGEEAA